MTCLTMLKMCISQILKSGAILGVLLSDPARQAIMVGERQQTILGIDSGQLFKVNLTALYIASNNVMVEGYFILLS